MIMSCLSGCQPLHRLTVNNCRGLHYIAKNVNERVKLIPDELKDYDIIGLQEVSVGQSLISSSNLI